MNRTAPLYILVLTLLYGPVTMALEEPDYDVLWDSSDVEIRRYAPYIVARVSVSGESADQRAFRILAGYIFGNNESGEKMAMTAPVETRGEEHSFVMERRYSMATLPRPSDERVQLRERPSRIVAVRRFSGRWSDSNFDRQRKALLDDLERLGIGTIGPPELARYNSPFTPWFLRRNEIVVPVNWTADDRPPDIATGTSGRL